MYWTLLTITFLSLLSITATIVINLYVLFAVFVSKQLKFSADLTLFYARFAIDVLFCFGTGANLVFVMFYYSGFEEVQEVLDPYRAVTFYIIWPSINFISIRSLLAFIITCDRTLAVYIPIKHHVYRRKVSNSVIIIVTVFGYCAIDNCILWILCEFELIMPPGCLTFFCMINACYRNYWLSFDRVVFSFIGFTSTLLVIKLFVWNNCSKSKKNRELSRANRLALIDTFMIIVFDLIPSAILARFVAANTRDLGTLGVLTKFTGFAIEAFLVVAALKRREGVDTEKSSRVSIKVRMTVKL
ncbi:unnamed protein product [Caenorhabditis sp. 36 PRJEB53466]|nr:unnamed protein product [Caenorhabditis sp. 36 PRJEB53466]